MKEIHPYRTLARGPGSLALLAARSRRWLESDAGSQRLMLRVVAVLLIGTAAFTAWQGLA